MQRFALIKTIVILVTLSLGSSVALADARSEAAGKFVRGLSEKVVGIMQSEISQSQKDKELVTLFKASVDIDWVAQFVAGRYWRASSKTQQSKFITLYRKFLIDSYIPKFRSYNDQKFVLKNTIEEDKNDYLVQTLIKGKEGQDIIVDYRIKRLANGSHLIYDVIAEGVSLITTQRSEFGSILSREGMDYLIERLEAKVGSSTY